MTAAAFTDAVRTMVGLPPVMRDHLLGLAGKLTDEQRADAIAKLQALHGDIVATSDELLKEVDAGEAELAAFRRTELPKITAEAEQEEHAAAEHILDEKNGAFQPPPPPPSMAA